MVFLWFFKAPAPPRLRYLDFVQGVTPGDGQAGAEDGETSWFRRVDTKFMGENPIGWYGVFPSLGKLHKTRDSSEKMFVIHIDPFPCDKTSVGVCAIWRNDDQPHFGRPEKNPAPVENGGLIPAFIRFNHPRWCRISSISINGPKYS